MKNFMILVFAVIMLSISFNSFAEYVNGYYRANGTYVNGYYRSDPNSTVTDNYSYKGNTNPYTGQIGQNTYRNNPSSGYYDPNASQQYSPGTVNINQGSGGAGSVNLQ